MAFLTKVSDSYIRDRARYSDLYSAHSSTVQKRARSTRAKCDRPDNGRLLIGQLR